MKKEKKSFKMCILSVVTVNRLSRSYMIVGGNAKQVAFSIFAGVAWVLLRQ